MKQFRYITIPVLIMSLVFTPLIQLAQPSLALAMVRIFKNGVSLQHPNPILIGGLAAVQSVPDPVIAAAGDIACDPANPVFNNGNGSSNACRQKYTSDLLVNAGLDAVLDLGDNQYYCGGYQAFLQSYDLSWGRVKAITHPAIGNHEYITTTTTYGGTDCNTSNEGATGYWNYFGTAAGTKGQGYYSFDMGAWHIIALNSDCTHAGGCSASSPEAQWLKTDLMTHTNYCTLAYWHVPLFSSGGRASADTKPFWQLLYDYDADLILNGHDHIYERFAPQDPNGVTDPQRGIVEFVVGTGGADHTGIPGAIAANSQVRNVDTYGVLKLTLHPGSADWQFVPEAGQTFSDTGTILCHQTDRTPPSTPTNLTATVVNTNQADLAWTASSDNVGITGYHILRNGVQIGDTTGTNYSDTSLQANMGYSYTVVAFDAASNVSAESGKATIPTPASSYVFSDGFESGNLSQWTSVLGLIVQQQEVLSGNYAARAISASGPATYARKLLPAAQSDLYYRLRFKVISQAANTVNLLKFRTVSDTPILSLTITSTGVLNYRNEVTATSVNSSVVVGKGIWQSLQVHVRIAGTSSQIETWYNDTPVGIMTTTESLGTNPIGRLQLGENTSGLTYDIAFDDVGAALGFIVIATPVATVTPTPTSTVTPTLTSTPTATPTATPTPTFTPTDTSTFSPTPTPTITATMISVPTFTPTPTSTASPTATQPPNSSVFSDGFESGNLSQWTSLAGLIVQQQEVFSGKYAARALSASGPATYARTLLAAQQSDLYYLLRFKVISKGANITNLLKFRTASDTSILSMSINSLNQLSYRNDVAGTSVTSTTTVGTGSWQILQVHVRIAGTSSLVEVWYNQAPVSTLTRTEALGVNPIGRLQLGENTSGLTYDIAFDDVNAATAYINLP